MSPDDAYRAPTRAERDKAVTALRPLLTGTGGADAKALASLGFGVRTGSDRGRPYVLAASEPGDERGWGMYVADRSAPPRLVIEVPHPKADRNTEELGVELHRRVPGSVVLIAGAHRRAAGNAADVAHRTDSLFHAVADDLAARGVPQVQLHGFDEDNLPEYDLVLSSGAARVSGGAKRAADGAEDAGLPVCRAWRDDCGKLEGTTNAQGKAAAEHGSVFLHIEVTGRLRETVASRDQIANVLAAAEISAP
ncbi:hypothetical protein FKR81_38670 [Lentzea tibetensis]|uniref:Uncharacterized protein n=2 Tax=Lentzea tibetensis TaxID=2591470 RepID=A0A563EGW8_9PSEU|nr:hypothetical protein FKR81_38670 [Lentzea tibetensis]